MPRHVEFPNIFQLRFSDEDVRQIELLSRELCIPKATLVRLAWRDWARTSQSGTNSEVGISA